MPLNSVQRYIKYYACHTEHWHQSVLEDRNNCNSSPYFYNQLNTSKIDLTIYEFDAPFRWPRTSVLLSHIHIASALFLYLKIMSYQNWVTYYKIRMFDNYKITNKQTNNFILLFFSVPLKDWKQDCLMKTFELLYENYFPCFAIKLKNF